MSKLVSIIVPVYNVETFLKECLNSLVAQDYPNTELILVDDGSTDNSGTICEEYKCFYNDNIRVIHKINGGLSDARNAGLEIAKGEYIAFVDSDDIVEPTFISTLVQAIEASDADIAQCSYLRFGLVNDNHKPSCQPKIIEGSKSYKVYFQSRVIDTIVCDKLFKRSSIGLHRFAVGKTMEDAIFLNEVLSSEHSKVVVICDELYLYRIREGSIMQRKFGEVHMLSSFYQQHQNIKICEQSYIELVGLAYYKLYADLIQYIRLFALGRLNFTKKYLNKRINEEIKYLRGKVKSIDLFKVRILLYFPFIFKIIYRKK